MTAAKRGRSPRLLCPTPPTTPPRKRRRCQPQQAPATHRAPRSAAAPLALDQLPRFGATHVHDTAGGRLRGAQHPLFAVPPMALSRPTRSAQSAAATRCHDPRCSMCAAAATTPTVPPEPPTGGREPAVLYLLSRQHLRALLSACEYAAVVATARAADDLPSGSKQRPPLASLRTALTRQPAILQHVHTRLWSAI